MEIMCYKLSIGYDPNVEKTSMFVNVSLSIFLQSLSTPMIPAPQTARSHNGAYRKKKRREKILSLTLNHVLDI